MQASVDTSRIIEPSSSAHAIAQTASNSTTNSLSALKPNKWSLPAHTSDQARQLMAGTVFNAKDAQAVAMQHQMQGHMAMGQHSSMSMAHHTQNHASQMNMPHASPAHSSHMNMQGMQMSSGVTAATATIGAALAVGGAAISIVNAHQLGKSWDQMSAAERAGETAKLTGTVALAGVGGTISGGLLHGGAMAVMPLVAVAGPAGLGAIATGNVVAGAYNGYKATQAIRSYRKISKFEALQVTDRNEKTAIGETLFSRAKQKLKSEVKNRFIKIGILALTTVGLVLGAALIGGLMATPVGWIAAGIVLTGFVTMTAIMLSKYIYQKYKTRHQANDAIQNEAIRLAALIAQQNNDNFEDQRAHLNTILAEIDAQLTTHRAKSNTRHFVEMLGARNHQKAEIINQRQQLRQWFFEHASLFDNRCAEHQNPIILKVLELNEDVLSHAARVLVREAHEQQS